MPIRPFHKGDLEPLIEIVKATNVFRDEEIAVAHELMEVAAGQKDQKDYAIYTYVDESDTVRGYYCIGQTPMTEATYDLYWIAVDPRYARQGNRKRIATTLRRVYPAVRRQADRCRNIVDGKVRKDSIVL